MRNATTDCSLLIMATNSYFIGLWFSARRTITIPIITRAAVLFEVAVLFNKTCSRVSQSVLVMCSFSLAVYIARPNIDWSVTLIGPYSLASFNELLKRYWWPSYWVTDDRLVRLSTDRFIFIFVDIQNDYKATRGCLFHRLFHRFGGIYPIGWINALSRMLDL